MANEIEIGLGQLGKIPYNPLSEEMDNLMVVRNEETNCHIAHFNETFLDIMKESGIVSTNKKEGWHVDASSLFLQKMLLKRSPRL